MFNFLKSKNEIGKSEAQKLYVFSLGNPGKQYEKTRHNAGRIVCERIINKNIFEKLEREFLKYEGEKKRSVSIEYADPDTYMNESGKFIKNFLKYKKDKDNAKVVIFYDDIDLPFAEVKKSFGRSAGGHNGVESVIKELGSKDFYRIRIGIGGKPHPEMLLQDYVLSKLTEDEVEKLKNLDTIVAEKLRDIVIGK